MKKLLLSVCAFSLTLATLQAGEITKYVNPFIGTGAIDGGLSGNNYPGATSPFGMIQLSPDTSEAPNWGDASGYDYNRNTIFGFSHTRLSGTGASDLIDITLMPTSSGRTSSAFTHDEEKARPGYYQVMLKDENINAELTTTQRNGIHRYQYPAGKDAEIILDMDHSADKGSWGRRIINSQIRILNDHAVEGYRIITGWAKLRKIYFYMEFSSPILTSTLRDGGRVHENTAVINGTNLHGCFRFGQLNGKPLTCKVALSSVSMETDVNGEYMAADYTTRKVANNETHYTTFSLWDTFRASHPLYTLLEPERVTDFVKSMIRQYEYYGYLPIWQLWGQDNYCMIGNHSIPVITDAILKGIPGIDMEKAYEAVYNSSVTSHPNSPFEVWEKYGFMPENIQTQSVSITLEQAFDDWCVAHKSWIPFLPLPIRVSR